MISSPAILATPYTWFFLTGAVFGAALSRIARRLPRDSRLQKARAKKWILALLLLSASICLAMAGIFIPGPEKVSDPGLLLLFAGTSLVSFFAFRFKRSVGLPVAFFAILLFVFFLLFLQAIVAFTGETEIARVRVLALDDSTMKLEIIQTEKEPVITTLEGQYFAPIVKVVIFADMFVFLGSKTWHRFEGITSFRLKEEEGGLRFEQAGTGYYFERPGGLSESLYSFFEKYEELIPGIKSVQVEMDLKRIPGTVSSWESFSVRVQNDGGVQIVKIR
jgi:hypothetical protein